MDRYDIDCDDWRLKDKPHGISGCFRLRNESEFMQQAVLSHLPWLDEAVLVVQPSDDNTVELAHQMADEHHKINVYYYPYECDWIDTPGFYDKDPNKPGHLVHMSNWALSKCHYSWIAKTEGDVIALSSFENICAAIDVAPDANIYYGRVVINLAGEHCDMISVDNPRNGGWDEAVFRNDPATNFFTRVNKWETIQCRCQWLCMGWSGLHMKRCKRKHWNGWNGEKWIKLNSENLTSTLRSFNAVNQYPGPDDPLGGIILEEVSIA